MSGLCGWFYPRPSDAASELDASRQLGRMARALTRFDGSPVHTLGAQGAAAALAAQAGSAHVHRQPGLLVALWGQAGITGAGPGSALAAEVAARWGERGPALCAELSGHFALCILDSARGEALLAIDRSGVHGLNYQECPDGVLFSSSADALLAHPAAQREIDPQSLYHYLYFHMVPAPRSIYRHQQRLLPGEYLHVRRGEAVRQQYWQMRFDEQQRPAFNIQRRAFLACIEEAVAASLGAARTGAFLSGGTDSSTLAAMLAKLGSSAARSYSIGFDAPGYDEMAYARIAAKHFGTVHHELYVSASDVVSAVPRLAQVFDQPFGNASAVPAYYCARMAHQDGITRLLGGDGGDELFGGNERYARQAVFERYERVPMLLRQGVLEPFLFRLATGEYPALLRKARSYIEQATVAMPGRLESYNLLQRYGSATVLDPEFLRSVETAEPLNQLHETYWRSDGLSQINRMSALDLKFTLADNDLPKVSKACELAGVEVAFPFLRDEVLAFAARLAPDQKLRGTQLRYFFKQALRNTLPAAILRKKKHGFGLPFGYWLQRHGDLQGLAYDSLSDLKARHIVRAGFIDNLLQRHLGEHPAYHGTMVWVLMMLEQWFRQREVRQTREEVDHGLDIRQA
ncbi:asparagine synthase [Oxalobacteraceae bacterium]|nr:asparagine synthase [Oxalobacteraceae bacterium]